MILSEPKDKIRFEDRTEKALLERPSFSIRLHIAIGFLILAIYELRGLRLYSARRA